MDDVFVILRPHPLQRLLVHTCGQHPLTAVWPAMELWAVLHEEEVAGILECFTQAEDWVVRRALEEAEVLPPCDAHLHAFNEPADVRDLMR